MRTLLGQAIAAQPHNAALHARLGYLELDRYDFGRAAKALEAAVRLDPEMRLARLRLALCYNSLSRYDEAIDVLAGTEAATPNYQRGAALQALGRASEAEAEFRAVLQVDPGHREACRMLCRIVRENGRIPELVDICEGLAARDIRHAQLLYDWGTALALAGQREKARAIMFDPARVRAHTLSAPPGFSDLAKFNAALANEILNNPYRLADLPADEANRGSSRVHSLFAGKNRGIIEVLVQAFRQAASEYSLAGHDGFDPWAEARPQFAHLRTWGLIQRGSDHEEWHLHRGGWMSGVYYVRVPRSVSAEGAGQGCIEFGPPGPVARAAPDFIPVRRYEPSEGMLLLAPSHYRHRTIPTGADEYRISIAFDVVAKERLPSPLKMDYFEEAH